MTGTFAKTFSAGCAVLAVLLSCEPAAWAGPPVPGPPPPYEVPSWPVPVAGQWHAPSSHGSRPSHGTAAGAAARVAAEVNRRRSEAGCASVRLLAPLNRAAQAHSADMAAHGRLTHSGTDGSRPDDRMRATGYRPRHTGEAVAAGAATAEAVVRQWMDSPPHRAILLTCRYTDAGVGRAGGSDNPWWTLDLAARQ